jgi:hypothetical protein
MQAHFVTFFSPGTFVAETTTKPIPSWDVDLAVAMSADIQERHAARPYGFRFITRAREDNELDSKQVASSPMYYIGGKVETLAEIEGRNDPNERILRSNMQNNDWDRVWRSTEGWQWTQPLGADDVVIEDYPALDDDAWSNLEYEEACETWASWSVRERASEIKRLDPGCSIFAARREELPQDDSGILYDMLRGC